MLAPWLHLTSSAQISSWGLASISAPSESSRFAFDCARVGLLRVRAHEHAAAEDAARAAAEDALVELAALAVRHGVVHHRVVVDELLAARRGKAVEARLGALASSTRSGRCAGGAPPSVSVWAARRASRSSRAAGFETWKVGGALALEQHEIERARPAPTSISATAFVKARAAAEGDEVLDQRARGSAARPDQQARDADAAARRAARELKTRWIGCEAARPRGTIGPGAVVEEGGVRARRRGAASVRPAAERLRGAGSPARSAARRATQLARGARGVESSGAKRPSTKTKSAAREERGARAIRPRRGVRAHAPRAPPARRARASGATFV